MGSVTAKEHTTDDARVIAAGFLVEEAATCVENCANSCWMHNVRVGLVTACDYQHLSALPT